jgi:hypothetical protein
MEDLERNKRNRRVIEDMLRDANKEAEKYAKPSQEGSPLEAVHMDLKAEPATADPAVVEAQLTADSGMHIEGAGEHANDLYAGDDPAAQWLRAHDPNFKPSDTNE